MLNGFLEASGEFKMENPWRVLVLSVDKVIAPMSTIHEGKVLKCNVSPTSPASIEKINTMTTSSRIRDIFLQRAR